MRVRITPMCVNIATAAMSNVNMSELREMDDEALREIAGQKRGDRYTAKARKAQDVLIERNYPCRVNVRHNTWEDTSLGRCNERDDYYRYAHSYD